MRMDYTILRIDDHSGRKSMLAEGTAEPVARPAMGKVNHFRRKSRHFPSDRIVIRDFCVNSHHDQGRTDTDMLNPDSLHSYRNYLRTYNALSAYEDLNDQDFCRQLGIISRTGSDKKGFWTITNNRQ